MPVSQKEGRGDRQRKRKGGGESKYDLRNPKWQEDVGEVHNDSKLSDPL